MLFSDAFNISRALTNGFETLKRFLAPMMVGGALMTFLDGGCNSGFNIPTPSDDDSDINWEALERLLPSGEGGASIQDSRTELVAADTSIPDLLTFLPGMDGVSPLVIFLVVLFVAGIVLTIGTILFGLRCWIETGWIRLHHRILTEGDGSMNHLFSGIDRLKPAVAYRLLVGCIGVGTTFVAMLPGGVIAGLGFGLDSTVVGIAGGILAVLCLVAANIYVQLGLALGMHAVVLDGCTAVEAMHQSWEVARGNRLTIFFFQLIVNILNVVAMGVGLLMLCIGALVTVPAMRAIGDFGFTESYLLFTRDAAERDQWQGVAPAP